MNLLILTIYEGIKIAAVLFACSLFWVLIKIMREVMILLKILIEKINDR